MVAIDKLKKRVQAGLSNPEYAEPEYDDLYETALAESDGIVGNKDLADAFVTDIAYYRFLLLVDSVSEQDERMYKTALTQLSIAGYKQEDQSGAVTTASSVRVKQRANDYM